MGKVADEEETESEGEERYRGEEGDEENGWGECKKKWICEEETSCERECDGRGVDLPRKVDQTPTCDEREDEGNDCKQTETAAEPVRNVWNKSVNRNEPDCLSPSWLLIAVPHETADEGPDGRDEECGGDENRGGDHDRLDEDLQEKDVCIGSECTQEGEDGQQRYGVQEGCVREPAGRGRGGRVWRFSGEEENKERRYETEGDGGAPDSSPDIVVVFAATASKVTWIRQGKDVDGPRMSIPRQERIRQGERDWGRRRRDDAWSWSGIRYRWDGVGENVGWGRGIGRGGERRRAGVRTKRDGLMSQPALGGGRRARGRGGTVDARRRRGGTVDVLIEAQIGIVVVVAVAVAAEMDTLLACFARAEMGVVEVVEVVWMARARAVVCCEREEHGL